MTFVAIAKKDDMRIFNLRPDVANITNPEPGTVVRVCHRAWAFGELLCRASRGHCGGLRCPHTTPSCTGPLSMSPRLDPEAQLSTLLVVL